MSADFTRIPADPPVTSDAETRPASALGRPYLPPLLLKIPVPLKLPRWLKEWMDSRPESRAKLIEVALINHFSLHSKIPELPTPAGKKRRRSKPTS